MTRQPDDDSGSGDLDVVPEVGMVLLFQHDIYHEGALVSAGVKHVVRSDIMYSDIVEEEEEEEEEEE